MTESALDAFLADVRSDAAPLVRALDTAIRRAAPLECAVKWRQLTYGVAGDYHHWICAVAVAKNRVTLNFHFGALLDDPEGAFRQGSSKFMRMLDYGTPADVDGSLIGRRVVDAVGKLEYFKDNWQRIQAEA